MSDKQRVACVIGYPAKHSRSPMLHRYWIKKYGLDADYRAEEIAPDDVRASLADLGGHGYVGANVTMPHKEVALAMSRPDQRALAVGAANTLWFEGDTLCSTNTDVEGFLNALDATAPGWDGRTTSAVVLGAGGAARAIIFGLIERGIAKVHVINRTLDKAIAMREQFGERVQPGGWETIPDVLLAADLLVNTTSLGMHGQAPLEIDTAGASPCLRRLRYRLCASSKHRSWLMQKRADMRLPTGSTCCCTKRCAGLSSGSACARKWHGRTL